MEKTRNGHFVWHDLLTKDPQAAIKFYGDVAGWKTERFGDSHYTMWVASQGALGGVMELPDEVARMGVPPHWMGNVQVANVDATVAQVKQLGGKVHKEPEDIPTVGRFAVIADPQGAAISIFQPFGEMDRHDTAKPGEMCWNELVTSDSAAAFEFYRAIFGWRINEEMDMGPMGTYRVFGLEEGKNLGGMMNTPQGQSMPPSWAYYIETPDLDAARDRSTQAGARVVNGPMDVPGGRIVQLMDPQGAFFALHQRVSG